MTTELTPTISPVDVPATPVVADTSRASIYKRVNVVRDVPPLAGPTTGSTILLDSFAAIVIGGTADYMPERDPSRQQ